MPPFENTSSASGPGPLIPDGLQLYKTFNAFLIAWANLASQYMPSAMEDMASLPLEQSIYFTEPFSGLFVIRTTREFEKYLVELESGKKAVKNFHDRGLFLEMTVLYWHRLALNLWKVDMRTVTPGILRASVPLDWPDRKPDSMCTLFAKDFPLEMRLWSSVSEKEMHRWKSPKK